MVTLVPVGETSFGPGGPPTTDFDPGYPSQSAKTLVPLSPQKPKEVTAANDLPEITAQKVIPAHERVGTDFKLLFTSEPWEKARIIAGSFPERVEVFQDTKTREPIVSLDGKHFVVNKKGFSAQDLNDFVAETGSYLIPTILSGGSSLLMRLGLGAITYGAADTARQIVTGLFGGKGGEQPAIDKQKVATTASVGAISEAFLPPVLKVGGRALRHVWSSGKQGTDKLESIIAAAASGDNHALKKAMQISQDAGDGTIPLTRGQQTGNPADIEAEAMMREGTGAYGEAATKVMQSADDRQMAAIERGAVEVQERVGAGSGFAPTTPAAIGTTLQDSLQQLESSTKAAAVKKVDTGRTALKEAPAFITGGTLLRGIDRLLAIPGERSYRAEILNMMPDAKALVGRLRNTRKHLKSGRVVRADYSVVDDFRKSIQLRINNISVGDRPEERALLIEMKAQLDDTIDMAFTQGIIHGEPATIALVKEGRGAFAAYAKKFLPRQKDKFGQRDLAGAKLQKILGGETPENVVNFFVNITRSGPKKETLELFDRVKNIFGDGSEEIGLIKDAAIYRMFTNANMKGKAELTRTSIVKNYFDFFHKNSSLANKMFSLEEREHIRQFVGKVARTVPAEVRMNPSGSGHVIARLLHDAGSGGLVSRISSLAKNVPVVGGLGGASFAKTLAYVNRLSSAPWGAVATAATDKEPGGVPHNLVGRGAEAVNNLLP